MPNYVRNLRSQYDSKQITMYDFILGVFSEGERRARGEHVIRRATFALLDLGGKGQWVRGQDIFMRAEFARYDNRTNHGLWLWNDDNGY